MDIEEVKKLIRDAYGSDFGLEFEERLPYLARQICQLEPKPDEGRLLTTKVYETIISTLEGRAFPTTEKELAKLLTDACGMVAKAQRDKTAAIKEAEFKEVCANCDTPLLVEGKIQKAVAQAEKEMFRKLRQALRCEPTIFNYALDAIEIQWLYEQTKIMFK